MALNLHFYMVRGDFEVAMRVLSIFFVVLFFVSCGSKDPALEAFAPTENIEVREDEQALLEPVEKACDLFSENHNEYASEFGEAFKNLNEKCQTDTPLNEKTESAVMESYAMASELFGNFNRDAHSKCVPQAKKILKAVYSAHLRNLKPSNANREAQKVLAKTQIDNLFRSLIRYSCLPDFESFSYTYKDEVKVFSFLGNHLVNGSFEYFKVDKNFTQLGRAWTLVDKKKIPGWTVSAVNPVEGKNCSLLEFQGVGVVTSVPHGFHLVELDGHCKNDQGQNVSGDARVEIRQQIPVKSAGSYRLTLKAQKRGGSHGDLQISVFQRGRDKEFESYSLPDQSVWSDVCVDVEITDPLKNVKVAIRDGEESGRQTYGLLIDEVSFEEGTCP